MIEYPKIPTMWKRDPATKHRTLIEGAWATPELEWLAGCDWIWTEKVDGTNIRMIAEKDDFSPHATKTEIAGRTARAQLPVPLQRRLGVPGGEMDRLRTFVADNELDSVTLYGEGCGPGIQKHGERYGDGQQFILFDVMINGRWQDFDNVREIGGELEIPTVRSHGVADLPAAADFTSKPFFSLNGEDVAEGLVLRPPYELTDRNGNRIMCKIKTKDFAP